MEYATVFRSRTKADEGSPARPVLRVSGVPDIVSAIPLRQDPGSGDLGLGASVVVGGVSRVGLVRRCQSGDAKERRVVAGASTIQRTESGALVVRSGGITGRAKEQL